VTVEAASPALIEKVRNAVTDGSGLYKITDLRPGTYTVTFVLPGFATVKREGVELSAGFTATINADMRVGGLEETVTVTGASPVVDVQNVREQRVLTREVLDTIPTAKSITNLAALIPGMTVAGTSGVGQDVGGSAGENFQGLMIHGGRRDDQQTLVDGMSVAMVQAFSGSVTPTALGDGTVEQTILEVSGHSAEYESGGIVANMLPKQGGNTLHGSVFGNWSSEGTQSNNYSNELRDKGLASPNPVKQISDLNLALGGPVRRDRVWFFTAYRDWRIVNYTDPRTKGFDLIENDWVYTPDLSKRVYQDQLTKDAVGRATWQATATHKVTFHYNWNNKLENFTLGGIVSAQGNYIQEFRTKISQATWSAPITNRLLLDAGVSLTPILHLIDPRPGAVGPTALETTTGQRFRAVAFGNAQSPQVYRHEQQRNDTYRAAVSYVTGAHAFKVGYTLQTSSLNNRYTAPADYEVNLVNGVPNSVVYLPTPFEFRNNLSKSAVYGQDQWKVSRLTMNLGLRYDHFTTRYPDYNLAPTNLLPARSFAGADVLKWNDLSPRLGASYDLFGNGKTAVKVSWSRYVLQESFNLTRVVDPTTASGGTLTRTWRDLNGDFVPQGDPLNAAANGELGPSPNNNFGRPVLTLSYDPEWAQGYGVRAYNAEFSSGIQRELLPRVAVAATYYRRYYGNFQVTDNRLVAASDYNPFCITAPRDARLPGGGGQQICDLKDLNPSRLGQLQQLRTDAGAYGEQSESWQGVDLAVNARLADLLLQGGVSTGKTVTDNCAVLAAVPEAGPLGAPYCHVETPYLTQVKFLGSYKLPWNIQVSGTFQSIPGGEVQATYVARNAEIAPSLGRNLSAGATSTINVNLIPPGTVFGDRINQVDMRFSRIFTIRTARIRAMVDLYNLANNNVILQWNNTYGTNGATWLQPRAIMSARLLKVGGQIDF
jgi:hypothetical protein